MALQTIKMVTVNEMWCHVSVYNTSQTKAQCLYTYYMTADCRFPL